MDHGERRRSLSCRIDLHALVTRSEAGAQFRVARSFSGDCTHQVAMSNRYPPSGTGPEAARRLGVPLCDPAWSPGLRCQNSQDGLLERHRPLPTREVLRSSPAGLSTISFLPMCHEAGPAAR